MDSTIVCIDQMKASVRVEPSAGWFKQGSKPTVELSGERDWSMVLGAITDDGDRIFNYTDEYLTGEHTKHFIASICEEIDGDILLILDNAPYFRAEVVTDLEENRDDLYLLYLPPYSPDMNPVEECWRQLQNKIGNKFFDSVQDLRRSIISSLKQISIPEVSNYF